MGGRPTKASLAWRMTSQITQFFAKAPVSTGIVGPQVHELDAAIIDQGQVVARDSTANLLGRLDGKCMVIQPDSPAETLPHAPGIDATQRPDGSIALSYRSQDTTAEEVLRAVHAAGISIRDVRTEQADLEDVFLALTGSR